MDRLAETGRVQGRWIIAPRKGAKFLGARDRARARARERRRRVFVVLLEALGLTFLMGLFPPLRPMWFATGVLFGLLVAYVGMLLAIRRNDREVDRMHRRFAQAVQTEAPVMAEAAINGHANGHANGHTNGYGGRLVATSGARVPKPTFNGLEILDAEDVHVVVRSARQLEIASAR
jgi:hypothetical protein